jgi:hypothetical protein
MPKAAEEVRGFYWAQRNLNWRRPIASAVLSAKAKLQ